MKTYSVYDVMYKNDTYLGTAFTRSELIELIGPIHSRNENGNWNITNPDAFDSLQGLNDATTGLDSDFRPVLRLCDAEYIDKGVRIYPTNTGHISTWLVRGVGKRAIKVIGHSFGHLQEIEVSRDALIVMAAKEANRRGWKKVHVAPDTGLGVYAEAFNQAMYSDFVYGNTSGGVRLCMMSSEDVGF